MNYLRSMPKDKLQKAAVVVVLSVIGVSAVGNFYICKQLSALSTSKREIAEYRTKIDDAERASKQAALDERVREQVAAFVEEQRATMVSGDPFGWFVRQVSQLAERHPVRLLGMRPGAKLPHGRKSGYQTFTARIEIEADYDQLGAFAADFENKFPTGEIRSLEISSSDANGLERHATMELALLILPDSDKSPTAAKKEEPKKSS